MDDQQSKVDARAGQGRTSKRRKELNFEPKIIESGALSERELATMMQIFAQWIFDSLNYSEKLS